MTIAQIEQQLLTAAQNNDMATISTVISSLTATQKTQIHPNVFDTVLQDVAQYSNTHGSANSTLLTFMKDVGAYTDAFAIGNALDTVTGGPTPNLAGAAYIIDNVTATQKPLIGGQALDMALQNIAQLASNGAAISVQATTEVKDFMTHLGANTDAFALGNALMTVTQGPTPNFTAAADIIDNVTAIQAPVMGSQNLDGALQNLAQAATGMEVGVSVSAATAEIKDFMTHIGANTDAFALGNALATVTGGPTPNFTAAANIIDNITATQAPVLGSQNLDMALQNLAQAATGMEVGVSSSAAAAEIKDFMTHIGANTDAFALGNALMTVTQGPTPNFTAAADIIDNVTAIQAPVMGSQNLDGALQNLAQAATGMEVGVSVSAATAEIKDFMTHIGANTDAFALGNALATVTGGPTPNFTAAANIIDNITATQAPVLGSQNLDMALQNLAQAATGMEVGVSSSAAAAEIKDFMTHIGANTDAFALGNALMTVTQGPTPNFTAAADIIDNVTATQAPVMGSQNLDGTLQNLAISLENGVSGAATEVQDLMSHLGAHVDQSAINFALSGFVTSGSVGVAAYAGEIENQNNILDHLTNAQWSGAVASIADNLNLAAYSITTGTANGDTINLSNSAVFDIVNGGPGSDKITGGNHGNILSGDAGNDTLIGGTGNDYLIAGPGSNILTGGAGADTFVFENLDRNLNHVTDFSVAQGDKIDLHEVLHFTNPTSMLITDFVSFTASNGSTIVSVEADGKGTAGGWVQVAQLDGVTGLSVQTLYNNHEIIA